jgi:hypothetical protein
MKKIIPRLTLKFHVTIMDSSYIFWRKHIVKFFYTRGSRFMQRSINGDVLTIDFTALIALYFADLFTYQ